jgi:hypothetical protein
MEEAAYALHAPFGFLFSAALFENIVAFAGAKPKVRRLCSAT